MEPEAKCFHVDAGKPCTRYLKGAEGEREAIAAFLMAIPEHVLDDWGLNAASEIHAFVESGTAAKGAWYWENYMREQAGLPNGKEDESCK